MIGPDCMISGEWRAGTGKTPEPMRRAFPCAHPRPGVWPLTLGPASHLVNARNRAAVDRAVDDLGVTGLVAVDDRGTTCGRGAAHRPPEPRSPAPTRSGPCGQRIPAPGS